jgi:hypothetical protein
MARPIRLLNLALGLVALLIAGALAKSWVAPAPASSSPTRGEAPHEPVALAVGRTSRPPLGQFDVVLEKNPFKQPPPLPPPPGRGAPPPPPPVPLPNLVGTILVDDERRAVLSDKGKANIYAIGEEVAGGKLTAISEDRVLYKRGDAVSELTLKAPIQSGGAPPPPAAQASPAPPPPPIPVLAPVLPPPGAIEGAPSAPGTPSRKAERRRARPPRQQQSQEAVPAPQGPVE